MMTLKQHNDAARAREEAFRNLNKAGIGCDLCGTELVYENKTSDGPYQHVRCPKCSFRGIKCS